MTGPFAIPRLADATWHEKITGELARQYTLLQKYKLDTIDGRIQQIAFECENFAIQAGSIAFKGHYSEAQHIPLVDSLARELIPWRKGPFTLGDLALDAEWRSDKKWDRLVPDLPDLTGQTIADVGCNNGYYLYRIASAGATQVIGFDPTLKYWLQYRLLAKHAPQNLPIEFLPLGWQFLAAFRETFDTIFLMGINYHEAEPLNLFHACLNALKPGGLLVCESVVVPGDDDLEILPAGKYAGIGGVYSIPTANALVSQLALCGFQNIRIQHNVLLTTAEQRRAEFSPQQSLADALSENGFSNEGQRQEAIRGNAGSGASVRLRYPPPHRAAIFAFR